MKNALFYYYQINALKLIKEKRYYYFEEGENIYYLYLVDRPLDYVNEVVLLNKYLINTKFMTIIYNINGQALSLINNHYYILLKDNKNKRFNFNDFYQPYYCFNEMLKLKLLDHSDWGKLWSSKIDYFEYQKKYIKIKYPILYKSVDYFIGFGENAISYFNAVNSFLKKDYNDMLVVSRRRVNFDDLSFYNPLNLVIDNKARDVGEYLKYIFIKDDYNDDLLETLITNLEYSNYQYALLMARVLFPSFYFDVYESIINGYIKEKEIEKILVRAKDYESYLSKIYILINKNQSIFKIDWLEVT